MRVTRRRILQIAAVSSAASAGCIADLGVGDDADDGEDRDPDENDDDDSSDDTGDDDPVDPDELDRVDEPPYEIGERDCSDAGEGQALYLCENMADEPSLAFEQEETTAQFLRDEGLRLDDEPDGEREYYATMFTEADDLDRLDPDAGSDPVDLIEGTDFETEAVLIVQTGWGSGSETPHLKRIEEIDEGIHAFGCSRSPCGGTDDYTHRTVVARFERPDALERGTVSLTVDPETRVNVHVGEGVVTLEE